MSLQVLLHYSTLAVAVAAQLRSELLTPEVERAQ